MGLELERDLQVLLFCISPLLLRLHKEHFQPSVCTSNDTKITELGLIVFITLFRAIASYSLLSFGEHFTHLDILWKNVGPKSFSWANTACFDFSSFIFILLGHIRRPTGAALNDYKRQNFEKRELDVEKLYLQHCKKTQHMKETTTHTREGRRYREKSRNFNDFLACIKG